jgi:hypothetical protein
MQQKREAHKTVDLAGRRFKIGRLDALTGSWFATKLVSRLSGIAMGIMGGTITDTSYVAMAVTEEIGRMTRAEFLELETDALSVVAEVTDIGGVAQADIPVMSRNGSWGVAGLEDDIITVMALVVHSAVFNLSPFFEGNALNTAKESFKDLHLFDAKI